MKKILVFNWKMDPVSRQKADKLFRALIIKNSKLKNKNSEIVVAPPFVYLQNLKRLFGDLSKVGSKTKNLKLGAQDVFWENPAVGGAYTGETSAKMLKDLGVECVIVGHSERRRYLGETDNMINKKIKAALKGKLKVVLCVGENLSIRRRGKKAVESFIENQLKKDLKGISNSLTVAYEPIWAIGAGRSDTPEDAVEMISFIRRVLNSKFKIQNFKILYGGSVNGKNIKDFAKRKEINGFLVGGASLNPKEFNKIIETVYN
ncbi:MAG: triose-phosphate isomerase [Patescibacteria group bacterium]